MSDLTLALLLAALDAAEKERDHWKDEAAQLDASVEKLEARVAALEKALTEHHAVGAMDGVCVGDVCPVCSRLGLAGSPPPVTPAPHCRYCGSLDWTVTKYGRVTHKQYCPHRTDPWHQGDPLVRQHEDDGA